MKKKMAVNVRADKRRLLATSAAEPFQGKGSLSLRRKTQR